MEYWNDLSWRASLACHDLVGWMMWDQRAMSEYASLGIPNGMGWVVAWRLAALGDVSPSVAASATYSINPAVIAVVIEAYQDVTDCESILAVRDAAVVPGLDEIAPGLSEKLGSFATAMWHGVDTMHHGARPMFVAHRTRPRPPDGEAPLSAWLAMNCLRELRGDNHWALCASEDLDDVEVGLLHSVMVDLEEYGDEEWIARSRGNDDEAIASGWARLEAKGLASNGTINETGQKFRMELEDRTNALTAPAWQAVGEEETIRFCELVEPYHEAFLDRINATAGPRWMPASRVQRRPKRSSEIRADRSLG